MCAKRSEKESGQQESRGWHMPASRGNAITAGLYVVATPIGNLGDMSFRALDVLAGVDVVLCEDTRVSGKLMAYYGIETRRVVYNDHSDAAKRAQVLKRIEGGEAVALISDAGMPLISDPGYKLVCDARDAGVMVTSVPGANAPLAALQLSGMPSDQFSFLGFLPSKQKARCDVLARWVDVSGTLIAFETAPRLLSALGDVGAVLGGRDVAVVREITKAYEEVKRGAVEDLVAFYEEHGAPKGEIVLVIAPPGEVVLSDADVDGMLRKALESMSTKDAAAAVAKETGLAKKDLYDRALKL